MRKHEYCQFGKDLLIGAKYTFSDVQKEFDERGYELLSTESEFENAHTKLNYICPKHRDKGVLKIDFGHLKSGRGCYYCGRERTEAARRKEIDTDCDKKLAESRGFEYVSSYKKDGMFFINFICKNHREFGVQTMRRTNMNRLIKGCKYCGGGGKYPEEYVINKLKRVNPDIVMMQPYTGKVSDKYKFKCEKHGSEFTTTLQYILEGRGCYQCGIDKLSQSSTLAENEVSMRVHRHNPHINLIEYRGTKARSVWFCTKHNQIFERHYVVLRSYSSGCDICAYESFLKLTAVSKEEFLNRLHEKHPNIQLVGEYKNYNTRTQFYCPDHNYHFTLTPNQMVGRAACCAKSRVNYKEEQMCRLIESWGYKITRQKTFTDCVDKNVLPFDCFIDDFNTIVEFDGEAHYYPVDYKGKGKDDAVDHYLYTLSHDKIKNDFCKQNGINLIRVPYYEYDSMEYFLFDEFVRYGLIEI